MLGQADVATALWWSPAPELWVPSLGPAARKVLGSTQEQPVLSQNHSEFGGIVTAPASWATLISDNSTRDNSTLA